MAIVYLLAGLREVDGTQIGRRKSVDWAEHSMELIVYISSYIQEDVDRKRMENIVTSCA